MHYCDEYSMSIAYQPEHWNTEAEIKKSLKALRKHLISVVKKLPDLYLPEARIYVPLEVYDRIKTKRVMGFDILQGDILFLSIKTYSKPDLLTIPRED